jgi:hypothetical protein
MHYLLLIEIITFYHQLQRQVKTDEQGNQYIETTLSDIEWANFLVKDTLLRKSDELSGETRQFFESLKSTVKQTGQSSFFAGVIRKAYRLHPMKLSRYLMYLEQRGLIKHTGYNRQTGYEYTITVWEDYQELKDSISILDRTLEKLKSRINGSSLHSAFTPLSQSVDVKANDIVIN